MTRRILVTGANKGIGLAICKQILEKASDTYVLLGSRDAKRGEDAVKTITDPKPEFASRIEMLLIDVSNPESIKSAAKTVGDKFGTSPEPLYGVVQNAGIALTGTTDFAKECKDTLDVNVYGVKNCCDSFIPLIQKDKGRIVMTSSAAGPNGVDACEDEAVKKVLAGGDASWDEICDKYINPFCKLAAEGGVEKVAEAKLTSLTKPMMMPSYYMSKAALNAYTCYLAKANPNLVINGFSPGFIDTELTAPLTATMGKKPSEIGAKTPDDGAVPCIYLLFAEATADFKGIPPADRPAKNVLPFDPANGVTGRYYGSDMVRSPLDKYRGPGDAPYGD